VFEPSLPDFLSALAKLRVSIHFVVRYFQFELATGGSKTMKIGLSLLFRFALLAAAAAQVDLASAAPDQAFWVDHWAKPKIILYGPDEEAFYQNLKEVVFARNEWDRCQNPGVLDSNARWLKAHPSERFFIDGYASSRGEQNYNLVLSQRRADWVKDNLILRGVSPDQIRLSVGWGELYPTCLEDSDECRARNKVVRFTYLPGS
jgi:hypothetical protein